MIRPLIYFYILLFTSLTYANVSFLTLADIHYSSQNRPGNGNDTGNILWSSTLKKLTQLSKSVDFIILLGDLPAHSLGDSLKSEFETKIFSDVSNANVFDKPIFYVSGNNDSLAGNYQPFYHNGHSPLDNAKDWQGACLNCKNLIIDKTFMFKGGYYSSYVLPDNKDLLLIVLNATQFAQIPFWFSSYLNQDKDAKQQLAWLENQLNKHQSTQLLIALHEEPGIDFWNNNVWRESSLERFVYLLRQYHTNFKQITVLAAHSHYDELRKITLNKKQSVYVYSTPSISRNHFNNPGMKVFQLNENLFLQDFITYFTDNEEKWENRHYHAIKTNHAIFPQCKNLPLTSCLDHLDTETICHLLIDKDIFGVKSKQVNIKNCLVSYHVN